MNTDDIFTKIEIIKAKLGNEKFPELSALLDYAGTLTDPADTFEYELASNIIKCDGLSPFPDFVREFVIGLYKEAIVKENPDAMNDLGALYYNGTRGFEQNYTKAVYYYTMAAENGCRLAQENLGYCYYYGRNMPVDYEKAFHFFSLGAFDGHIISLYKIGDMYHNGYYVKKNDVEAFSIYTYCISLLNENNEGLCAGPVYLRLGNMYLDGLGTKSNALIALECYQKAEKFLYQMVAGGDRMYGKSLDAAIEGQNKARAVLKAEL